MEDSFWKKKLSFTKCGEHYFFKQISAMIFHKKSLQKTYRHDIKKSHDTITIFNT